MKTAGIAAEYNPFHKGHLHHLSQTRKILGEDAPVVCVMSGDFVQRGTPAVFSKYARAEAAVLSGVSLALELPLPWALSSAEGFARGAVGLLAATGVVDILSFGSEAGNLEPLCALATALADPALDAQILTELEKGTSYAASRETALAATLGAELASLLRTPNNILAVEYIKAIDTQRVSLETLTIPRVDARHDGPGSASELRGMLEAGEDISSHVPSSAMQLFREELRRGRGPVTMAGLEIAALSRLRALPLSAYRELPDASEGLENLLYRAAREEPSLDAIISTCKSKRYALSRLRRMVMCAVLGVQKGMADATPPYIRVLAMDGRGRSLLREMRERASVPVIVKPASVREMGEEARRVFTLGSKAHDFWVLGYTAPCERGGGEDWRSSPIVTEESEPR